MKIYINSGLQITHYKICNSKVKSDLRLAVVADLHNCVYEDKGRRLFDMISSQSPDIVVIAGDITESVRGSDATDSMIFLKRLSENFPVIFGIGNHERRIFEDKKFYHQRKQLETGLKESGLKILRNAAKIYKKHNIKITGLDLPLSYFRRFEHVPLGKEKLIEMIGELEKDYFNVLIAHDPLHFKSYSDYGPELIISGHVHGGIIRLPFLGGLASPEITLFPEYDAGSYTRNGSQMLVSKGLGTHTLPLRINDPRELMIVDIKRENDD